MANNSLPYHSKFSQSTQFTWWPLHKQKVKHNLQQNVVVSLDWQNQQFAFYWQERRGDKGRRELRGDKGSRLKGGGYGGECDGHEKDLRCRNKLNVDTFSNTATLWDGAAWKRGSIGILWKEENEERKEKEEKEERAIAFPSQVLVCSLRWRWITKSFCTLQRRDRRDLLRCVYCGESPNGFGHLGSGLWCWAGPCVERYIGSAQVNLPTSYWRYKHNGCNRWVQPYTGCSLYTCMRDET